MVEQIKKGVNRNKMETPESKKLFLCAGVLYSFAEYSDSKIMKDCCNEVASWLVELNKEEEKKEEQKQMKTNIIVRIRTKIGDYEIDVDKTLEDVENGSTWSFVVSDLETVTIRKKE